MQVLFLVGNDAWASSEDTKEILQLLGCPKALSTFDILWVGLLLCPSCLLCQTLRNYAFRACLPAIEDDCAISESPCLPAASKSLLDS